MLGSEAEMAAPSPAQRFALGAGIVYAAVGIIGFAVTGVSHFAAVGGRQLLVFGINPLHNLIHLATAGALLWASRSERHSRKADLVLGGIFLLLAIVGFAGFASVLAIEPADADNFLHLSTAALALYFGAFGTRSADAMSVTSVTTGHR